MRLSPSARLAVGLVSIVLFGLGGVVLYGNGRTVMGGVLIALAAFRTWTWIRQCRDHMAPIS